MKLFNYLWCAVAKPDLQIRGWSQKEFFSALRASVWSKNKRGRGQAPRAPPLDQPLLCIGL